MQFVSKPFVRLSRGHTSPRCLADLQSCIAADTCCTAKRVPCSLLHVHILHRAASQAHLTQHPPQPAARASAHCPPAPPQASCCAHPWLCSHGRWPGSPARAQVRWQYAECESNICKEVAVVAQMWLRSKDLEAVGPGCCRLPRTEQCNWQVALCRSSLCNNGPTSMRALYVSASASTPRRG